MRSGIINELLNKMKSNISNYLDSLQNLDEENLLTGIVLSAAKAYDENNTIDILSGEPILLERAQQLIDNYKEEYANDAREYASKVVFLNLEDILKSVKCLQTFDKRIGINIYPMIDSDIPKYILELSTELAVGVPSRSGNCVLPGHTKYLFNFGTAGGNRNNSEIDVTSLTHININNHNHER